MQFKILEKKSRDTLTPLSSPLWHLVALSYTPPSVFLNCLLKRYITRAIQLNFSRKHKGFLIVKPKWFQVDEFEPLF